LLLTVLHVNHGLRPEADQEQQFVESLSQRWKAPCVVGKLTPRQQQSGIEAWARKERYRFFQQWKEQHRLDAIAVAHTRDDQAETVLFRLLRGAGRRGLAGIPPQRDGWLIRPLLNCSRQEVMAYLRAKHLPYLTDPSNTDLRFTRNKIRHVLLPFLEHEFSPQIRLHLVHLAESLRQEEAWLTAQAQAAFERVRVGAHGILLEQLRKEPIALHARLLQLWLEQAGHTKELSFRHLSQLVALSMGRIAGAVAMPGGWIVRREDGRLLLTSGRAATRRVSYAYVLMPGASLTIPEVGWEFSLSLPFPWGGSLAAARQPNLWQALFDADVLTTALTVRNRQPGDRLQPFGMEGHKKVHDLFVDKKIAQAKRSWWPLVASDKEVLWIPGLARGSSARITEKTQRVMKLVVNPLPEN
jgi:tRNA(Ile)-lysidine synthase